MVSTATRHYEQQIISSGKIMYLVSLKFDVFIFYLNVKGEKKEK